MFDIYDAYKEHVEILSINPINPRGRILSDLRRFDAPFPVLEGRGSRIIRDYKIRSLPAIYIIDKAGEIVAGGKYMSFEKLETTIKSMIAVKTAEIE
ncbi:redoxin domain-containing protein [bacterium]|nr:redoxin domain-containing protein [bacterium]